MATKLVTASAFASLLTPGASAQGFGGPASFDCAMRKLAYEFGQQLLPRHGAFPELFDSLGLNVDPECNATLGGGGTLRPSPARDDPNLLLPAGAVFVDPLAGDDAAWGDEARPLVSVQAACDRAGRGGTVVLRGGSHFLAAPLALGEAHSGQFCLISSA